MFIPSIQTGVEIDGYPWHSRRIEADARKVEAMATEGINLVRIRDTRLPTIEGTQIPFHGTMSKDHINQLVQLLGVTDWSADQYLRSETFANEPGFWSAASVRKLDSKRNSLAYRDPALAREWDYQKNHPALPTYFDYKSNAYAWWTCPTCGASYKARISHRTDFGSDCPYCAGRAIKRERSLAALHPGMLKEWDWEKNDVDPYTLTPSSNLRA